MRIVGGRHRGRTLAALGPGDPAAHLRPTADRVRESLFNLLAHGSYGDPVSGARVLDLFAGTGALGLEAISRGAAAVTFVETSPKALALIRRNVALLDAGQVARVLPRDATRLGQNPDAPFDLAFLDPPYGSRLGEAALASAATGGWLAPGALVTWEDSAAPPTLAGFALLDLRGYRGSTIAFLRRDA